MRRAWKILLIAAVLAVAARAALPFALHRYVNETLSRIPGYKGETEGIGVALIRGAYTIRGLNLVKLDGKVPVPLFKSRVTDLSIRWRALLDGALVAEIEFRDPELNFAVAPQAKQTKIDRSWKDVVKALFPLRFDRVAVHNGQIHYRDFTREPHVDIYVDKIEGEARNLTNSLGISKSLMAHIDMNGTAQASAPVDLDLSMNPFSEQPNFSLKFAIRQLDLTRLNQFLKAYAYFDVRAGNLELYSELEVKEGKFNGYMKPLITGIDAFNLNQGDKSVVEVVWQSLVGTLVELFKNQRHDRIGSRVPISGTFEKPNPDVLPAIASLLYNAFVEALKPGLEGAGGDANGKTED